MEPSKKGEHKTIRRKKANFLSRLGHRISKVFTKSKSSKNDDEDMSKSCLDDLPVTSKSHDNLTMKEEPKKTKRKKYGSFLNIPAKNDRCLSEGDLTRDDDKFYSADSSPKSRTGRTHNDSSETDTLDKSGISVLKDNRNFKNELALKLRNKNPAKPKKDEESDSSKTPDSPPGHSTGMSPSRQLNGSRTPYSLSSASHSSNSLLSGNVPPYPTSDADSMSRSAIDCTDDIGIVVDLATPISKTTTGSLLDSSAARQKIAASRPRRARPKANDIGKSNSGDKSKESGKFSPVREIRDVLEEISEEDCQPASTSPTIIDDNPSPIILCSKEETKIELDVPTKSEFSPIDSSPIVITNTLTSSDVPSPKTLISDPIDVPRDEIIPIFNPSTVKVTQPNETGDSSVKFDFRQNKKRHVELSTSSEAVSHTDTLPVVTNFKINKMKFESEKTTPPPDINLRPVRSRFPANTDPSASGDKSKFVANRTSWAPGSRTQTEHISQKFQIKDDQFENKTKINRYTPMHATANTNPEVDSAKQDESKLVADVKIHSQINPNAVDPDKRKSRVIDMIKNLEGGIQCADST